MHVTTFVMLLTLLVGVGFSSDKKFISPPGTKPDGNYSQGILTGGTLYISGQDGADAAGNYPADFDVEVRQTFNNIDAVLKAGGMTSVDVVSAQVYLTDKANFPRMNAIWREHFRDPRPTRTTIGVGALMGPGHIEITITARK